MIPKHKIGFYFLNKFHLHIYAYHMETRNNCFVTQQVVSLLPDGQWRNKKQIAILLNIITVVLLVGEMCTSKKEKF